MTTFEQKATELRTKRAAFAAQHQTLTEQLGQITIGLHQIDGALAILGELETEAAASPELAVEAMPGGGLPVSRNGPAKSRAG